MSRFSIVVVSMAILGSASCAPGPISDVFVELWSPSFDNAVNRCAAISAPSGSADCIERMRRVVADEKRYGKMFCYTVIDRVVCKKDPLHSYDAASTLDPSPRKAAAGR